MARKRLKFGIISANGTTETAARSRLFGAAVKTAEDLGYDMYLFSDHYLVPWRRETFDTWTLLAHLAGMTERIKLGTSVTPLPFRPPQLLAKMIAYLDTLCNGRLIVGMGAGWAREEFEGYAEWYPERERFERSREAAHLIRRLLTEEEVNFEGKYYSSKGATVMPKSIQKPHPPFYFGSRGRRMLELAAELGQGWIYIGPRWRPEWSGTLEEFREGLRIITDANTSARGIVKVVQFGLVDDFNLHVKEVEEWAREGLDYYMLVLTVDEKIEERMRGFWSAVASRF